MDKYLDKLVEVTKETMSVIGQKTDELIDYSKHKIKKSSLESELGKVYTKLGKVVYDSKKSGEDESVLISLIVSEIDAIKKSMDNLDKEVEEKKTTNKYQTTGYDNVKEDKHDVKIEPVETVDFIPEVSEKEDNGVNDSDVNIDDSL